MLLGGLVSWVCLSQGISARGIVEEVSGCWRSNVLFGYGAVLWRGGEVTVQHNRESVITVLSGDTLAVDSCLRMDIFRC